MLWALFACLINFRVSLHSFFSFITLLFIDLASESNFSDWFDGDNSPLGLDYDQDFTFEIWFKPAGNHLFKTVTNGGTERSEVLVDMGTEHGALKVTFNDGPAGDDFGLYIQYRGNYLYFDPLGTWGSSYDHFMTDEDGDGNGDDDDEDTFDIVPAVADLSLDKSVTDNNGAPVNVGDVLTFSLAIAGNHPFINVI